MTDNTKACLKGVPAALVHVHIAVLLLLCVALFGKFIMHHAWQPHKSAVLVAQLRTIMQKKLTTSVEEDASVSEHYNEVCKREARVSVPSC